MTIIIVEQSLNVALVDRRPRHLPREGPGALRGPGRTSSLERDDLARAVFLGTEGG